MNKKFIIIILLFAGLLFIQIPVKAQTQNPLPELPKAGLTPNSPFYFLERAVEALQDFLTFNNEKKAKLQAKRALERVAEVKLMLSKKDINPKGLDIALLRLKTNAVKAASIIQKEKQKGKDVSTLAKELDTDFEIRNKFLKQTFEEKGNQIELIFKKRKLEFKKQLIDAKIAGNLQKVREITLALDKLTQEKQIQESLLERRAKESERSIEAEEKNFEMALEAKERENKKREKETELILEQKKEELKKQLEKEKQAQELKDESLENQLDAAISLGDKEKIENIKKELLFVDKDSNLIKEKEGQKEQREGKENKEKKEVEDND